MGYPIEMKEAVLKKVLTGRKPYIEGLVGGNSLWANLFASVSGLSCTLRPSRRCRSFRPLDFNRPFRRKE